MEKSLISLSFDDGRADQAAAARDLLLPQRIPATFNITTGYVDGTCPMDHLMTDEPPMTVEDVKWLAQNDLFEIALHGHEHLNTPDDVRKGYWHLVEWLGVPENMALGFASPYSAASPKEIEADPGLNTVVSYIRMGYRAKTFRPVRVFARKLGRVFHLPYLYRFAFRECMMDDNVTGDERCLFAVPVMGDATVEQVTALLDECIVKKKAVILMFHSIKESAKEQTYLSREGTQRQQAQPGRSERPSGQSESQSRLSKRYSGENAADRQIRSQADSWSWDVEKMRQLLNYLMQGKEEGDVEIVTTKRLYECICMDMKR